MGIEEGRGEILATATMSPRRTSRPTWKRGSKELGGYGDHCGGAGQRPSARRYAGAAFGALGSTDASLHVISAPATMQGRCSVAPTAEASGEIVLAPDRPAVGRFNVQAEDFALGVGNTTIAATSLAGDAQLSSAGVSATARLTDLSAGARERDPTIRSHTAELSGRFPMSSASPAVTELHGVLAGTSFDWGTFTAHSAETQIETTWDGQQLTSQVAASTLRMAAEGGAPRGWHADIARAALQTNLRMTDDKLHGPLHLEASRLVGRAGLTGIQGDIAADFSLGSSDPSYRTTDFGGVVRLRNVALQAQRGEAHDWWADLGIEVGHLDTRENFDVTGRIQADSAMRSRFCTCSPRKSAFRDGSRVLSTSSCTPRPRLRTLLSPHRRPDSVARGDQLEAKTRLLVGPGKVRGALHLRDALLGFLSVGFDFAQEDMRIAPFAGTSWYGRQLLPLEEMVSERRAAPCSY